VGSLDAIEAIGAFTGALERAPSVIPALARRDLLHDQPEVGGIIRMVGPRARGGGSASVRRPQKPVESACAATRIRWPPIEHGQPVAGLIEDGPTRSLAHLVDEFVLRGQDCLVQSPLELLRPWRRLVHRDGDPAASRSGGQRLVGP